MTARQTFSFAVREGADEGLPDRTGLGSGTGELDRTGADGWDLTLPCSQSGTFCTALLRGANCIASRNKSILTQSKQRAPEAPEISPRFVLLAPANLHGD